jgi:hypothetical protein
MLNATGSRIWLSYGSPKQRNVEILSCLCVNVWLAFGLPLACLWLAFGLPLACLWLAFGLPLALACLFVSCCAYALRERELQLHIAPLVTIACYTKLQWPAWDCTAG